MPEKQFSRLLNKIGVNFELWSLEAELYVSDIEDFLHMNPYCNYISGAFRWSSSIKGSEFWKRKDTLWKELLKEEGLY